MEKNSWKRTKKERGKTRKRQKKKIKTSDGEGDGSVWTTTEGVWGVFAKLVLWQVPKGRPYPKLGLSGCFRGAARLHRASFSKGVRAIFNCRHEGARWSVCTIADNAPPDHLCATSCTPIIVALHFVLLRHAGGDKILATCIQTKHVYKIADL